MNAETSPHFSPHATALNVIPSRQNVFLPHSSWTRKWCSCLEDVYSVGTQRAAEASLAIPRPRAQSSGVDSRPLLYPIQEIGAGDGQLPATPPGPESSGDEHLLSLSESVFNLANTVIGVGVLSVPYAFRLCGYSCILITLLVIVVAGQTGIFIGSALVLASRTPHAVGVPSKGRDFAFLAHICFGRKGRALIGAVTSLEIWFALVTFIVMSGTNITLVFPEVSSSIALTVSCLLSVPMMFVPMRIFSYLSLVASLSLVIAGVALVCAALTMQEWANPYNHLGHQALVQWANVPRSVGIIVFCFAGHPCFPVVHESMKDRRDWRCSICISFFLAFLYYGGLGVFGYLVFGEFLEASVTNNIAYLPRARFFRHVSAIAFVVKIQLTAPFLLNAILVSFYAPRAGESEWPWKRVLALLGLTAVTACTAMAFAKDVAVVAAFTGSLFTMTTSVLFPALAHLCLARRFEADKEARRFQFLRHYLVLGFGVTMAISGTTLSVRDFLQRRS
eukprot:TRINITY_DN24529_c0_g1_i3.p1 TRINITY_DN24529_c0_g1~~TRINITY_DN24529_c0_g1_i3.p1  ORF type:complete len:551 (-),score=59.66 TRINITY_DN24529_c0_g1_i3:70-1584(-)